MARRGRRITTTRSGALGRKRAPAAKKRLAYRGCPLKVTLECFSFTPLDTTVEALNLTPEQIELYGLRPGQRLQWCSECENVFHVSSNKFAYIIGKRNIPEGSFIPGAAKNSRYIG